jgi:hypothetical protein
LTSLKAPISGEVLGVLIESQDLQEVKDGQYRQIVMKARCPNALRGHLVEQHPDVS